MFIVPINSVIDVSKISSIGGNAPLSGVQNSGGDEGVQSGAFREIFQGLIDNVETTEAQTKLDAYNLSIGNMDDMHTMIINATKAEVALQTMVELRNKMLTAYQDIISTTV